MNTKNVLLVLGGVALGYLASKKNWGSKTATAVGDVATGVKDTATGVLSDVKDIVEIPEGTGGIKAPVQTVLK